MATSGEVAVKFIIKHIPNPRLIPIITSNATTSKSKEIRRACCEFIESMLALWPSHSLERHVVLLQEAIKKGVADADPEARVLSRKYVLYLCYVGVSRVRENGKKIAI